MRDSKKELVKNVSPGHKLWGIILGILRFFIYDAHQTQNVQLQRSSLQIGNYLLCWNAIKLAIVCLQKFAAKCTLAGSKGQ